MDSASLKQQFGRRVRSLRKLRDLTQDQLAEAAQVSAEYVGKVERGLAAPSFDAIARIADALEVEPGSLFDFTELRP